MATGNAHITVATGGIISANVTTTVGGGSIIVPANFLRKNVALHTDRISPPRCNERKGGPRSKIYCEQFEAGKHTVHVGRSATGRWYTWSDNE